MKKLRGSPKLRAVIKDAKGNVGALIEGVYLTVLSRPPSDAENQAARKYLQTSGLIPGAEDLVWALVNTKEFLFRH
jgi:hypothetical protein